MDKLKTSKPMCTMGCRKGEMQFVDKYVRPFKNTIFVLSCLKCGKVVHSTTAYGLDKQS